MRYYGCRFGDKWRVEKAATPDEAFRHAWGVSPTKWSRIVDLGTNKAGVLQALAVAEKAYPAKLCGVCNDYSEGKLCRACTTKFLSGVADKMRVMFSKEDVEEMLRLMNTFK